MAENDSLDPFRSAAETGVRQPGNAEPGRQPSGDARLVRLRRNEPPHQHRARPHEEIATCSATRAWRVSITDPENPYRYLGIQGRVSEMTENGADAHIDKLAKKYLNKDKYPFRAPGEVRVLLKIVPEKVHTNG